MKRSIFVVLSLTLSVLVAACASKTPVPSLPRDDPPGELPIVVTDDFAGSVIGREPENWRIVYRGETPDTPYVSDVLAHSGDRSLLLERQPENSHIANGVVLDFSAFKRHVIASFWFCATDPGRTLVVALSSNTTAANPFGASAGPFLV